MKTYTWEHKVQYYETDQMRIVHHSNYIRWMEESRVWALEQAGYGCDEMERDGVMIPVLSVAAQYKTMSHFGESVLVTTSVRAYNGIRLSLQYEVRDKETGELRCTGESSHCFLRMSDRKLVSLKKSYPRMDALFRSMTE